MTWCGNSTYSSTHHSNWIISQSMQKHFSSIYNPVYAPDKMSCSIQLLYEQYNSDHCLDNELFAFGIFALYLLTGYQEATSTLSFGNKPLISRADVFMFVTLLYAGPRNLLKLKLKYLRSECFEEFIFGKRTLFQKHLIVNSCSMQRFLHYQQNIWYNFV